MNTDTAQELLIGIVAGENSGDQLGAGLIRELKQILPTAKFVGLAGPKMMAEGCVSLAPMERLSVMGIVEPLKRLPELLGIRRDLKRYFFKHRPAVVIGIDSPDFNLPLEKALRRNGIKTCHYVCPSVWAWRQGRVKGIRQSVDKLLALLPFETEFLLEHNVPSSFVGHPLADRLSKPQPSRQQARLTLLERQPSCLLDVEPSEFLAAPVICLMPGSRNSELELLGDTFLATANWCLEKHPELFFVVPAATVELGDKMQGLLSLPQNHSLLSRTLVLDGDSHTAMLASDAILLASGTATLEAALLKRPMVVAYKLAAMTYAIASKMVKIDHVALPNLLTEKPLVPEFIQHEAEPEALGHALMHWLDNPADREELLASFELLGEQLARNADVEAARQVVDLLDAV